MEKSPDSRDQVDPAGQSIPGRQAKTGTDRCPSIRTRVCALRLHLTVFFLGRIDTLGLAGANQGIALLLGRQIFLVALGSGGAARGRISGLLGLRLLAVLILVGGSGESAQRQSQGTGSQHGK
jgi:hypothetical protein